MAQSAVTTAATQNNEQEIARHGEGVNVRLMFVVIVIAFVSVSGAAPKTPCSCQARACATARIRDRHSPDPQYYPRQQSRWPRPRQQVVLLRRDRPRFHWFFAAPARTKSRTQPVAEGG